MEQTTSIKVIIDKLLRHPLLQDLSFETAIDFTIDFMKIVGCPQMFEEKVVSLEIKDYRAMLPCDYYKVIQVRDSKTKKAYLKSSDSFHMAHDKDNKEYTYKIQGSIIYTSQKEGCIDFSYRAIDVDDEGYPLIPDNSSFTRALTAYIKKEWFTILFDTGKINPAVLQMAQQDYAWAVGDCQSEFIRMTIDDMESFSNSWNTLISRAHQHNEGFKDNNKKENWRLH